MFAFLLIAMQAAIIILFLIFFDYSVARELTIKISDGLSEWKTTTRCTLAYPLSSFWVLVSSERNIDISVFLRLVKRSLALKWAVVIQGLLTYIPDEKFYKIGLTLPHLIEGLYAAAAVVISLGVVLGQLNVHQLTLMTFPSAHVSIGWLSCDTSMHTYDTGYSMFVHVFGRFRMDCLPYCETSPQGK